MTLRPYQIEGAEWLAARSAAYLGDAPGLGKTRTVLTGAVLAGAERVAVVCPAVVVPHWAAEAAQLEVPFQLMVVSYQKLVVSRPARTALAAFGPDTLVCDEAHHLARASSKRTQLLLGSDELGPERLWLASGTPMPRNPFQLYPALRRLNRVGIAVNGVTTPAAFLDRYCRWFPTEYGPKIVGSRNEDEFRALLAPVLLRRRARDVLPDLPPLRWGTVELGQTPDERAALADQLDALPDDERHAWSMSLANGELPRLSDNLSIARHAIGRAKVGPALALVAAELEADPDLCLVLFAYHRDVIEALRQGLEGYGARAVTGATPAEERIVAARILGSSGNRVFIGQVTAAGEGLDGLQHQAHEAVIVEPDWSAHVNVQAAGRLARFGQTEPVQVRFLALAQTLDAAIVRQHHRETDMVGRITG